MWDDIILGFLVAAMFIGLAFTFKTLGVSTQQVTV